MNDTLYYTSSHEWVRLEEQDVARVGITQYAAEALGDVVFVELPKTGVAVSAGAEVAVVESVKAASDIYAPVSGEVLAVNTALAEKPEQLNQSPQDAGWMFTVKLEDKEQLKSLLDEAAYAELCAAAPLG